MTDTKQANRVAVARDEGIYRRRRGIIGGVTDPFINPKLECLICGKVIGTSALSRASHGKKHVREGRAVARTEYGYDGPRTIYDLNPQSAGVVVPDRTIDAARRSQGGEHGE